MEIISHRGFWLKPEEKNSYASFVHSFKSGYGTETDLRDALGEVVISHDIPIGKCISFDEFIQCYKQFGHDESLALNIKADGLQVKVKEILQKYDVQNYFLFDMSIPDLRSCVNQGLKSYTRISDIEPHPVLLDSAIGLWVDTMEKDWLTSDILHKLDQYNKTLCFVSPELHRRPHEDFWSMLKTHSFKSKSILCTDLPDQAEKFFAKG